MSEAIRSGGAFLSGAISDRGSRDAQHESIRGLQDQGRSLRNTERRGIGQLSSGYRAVDAMYEPYTQTGIDAYNNANANSTNFQFDPSQIENNPAYNFRMNQGLEALNRSFAARGGLGSGNRMLGITDYAQGLASTEYENEYRRQYGEFSDNFNRQMGIAGMGFDALRHRAANTQQYRGDAAGLIERMGMARAGIFQQAGDVRAGTALGRAANWAGTNMYMADQAGQGFDRYVPISRMGGITGGGGGGKFSMGGGN